ncbi:MAG: hypothetical protein HW407_2213 [Bacteroidetes bacterium]|nr:hypothetical protein [Bacteroidota bacterium]
MKRILTVLFLSCALAATAVVPAIAQKSQKKETTQAQNTIKDILMQYVGKATNLGTLKKVAADHFVLEEEGNTVMHPLSALHTIKLVKNEESGEMKIEIRLVGKD